MSSQHRGQEDINDDGEAGGIFVYYPNVSKRYHKEKKLEDSVYGGVWLAHDMWTNQQVVIKSSVRNLVEGRRQRDGSPVQEDVMEEIRIHRKLNSGSMSSPWIVKLLDVVETVSTIDIVLEYCSGGDMYNYYKAKTERLTQELEGCKGTPHGRAVIQEHFDEVRRHIKQVLQAVEYLHSRKIAHRDISLENIMLDSKSNIRLIDFGNSREYADGKWLSQKRSIGKKAYMSPECYINGNYDARDNDVWCVGVCLFQMLIGSRPWSDRIIDCAIFKKIYEDGYEGIKHLMWLWKMTHRMPEYAIDFFAKIFCPQKSRLTVQEALGHPFFTNSTPAETFFRRKPIRLPEKPDGELRRMAHLARYKSLEIPNSWLTLNEDIKDKIIGCLLECDKDKIVLDRRVVGQVSRVAKLTEVDARRIILYLWAAPKLRNTTYLAEQEIIQANSKSIKRSTINSELNMEEKCENEERDRENIVMEQTPSDISEPISCNMMLSEQTIESSHKSSQSSIETWRDLQYSTCEISEPGSGVKETVVMNMNSGSCNVNIGRIQKMRRRCRSAEGVSDERQKLCYEISGSVCRTNFKEQVVEEVNNVHSCSFAGNILGRRRKRKLERQWRSTGDENAVNFRDGEKRCSHKFSSSKSNYSYINVFCNREDDCKASQFQCSESERHSENRESMTSLNELLETICLDTV